MLNSTECLQKADRAIKKLDETLKKHKQIDY